jgi:GntR family transcriptional regulator
LAASSFPYENLGRLCSHHFDGTNFRLYAHGAIIDSIIPHVKIDRSESLALHEQVAAEIRRAIAEGEAAPGERMPPARDLAAILGVNSNTVLRALRLLRDEGLLEFRRGRGVTVAGTPERTAVIVRARELVEFARRQGFRSNELIEIIEGLP